MGHGGKLGKHISENRIECHSDGYSTYFDEEYKECDPDVEIAVPEDKLGENHDEFIYKVYDEIPLAATVRFPGSFDGGYSQTKSKATRQSLVERMKERQGFTKVFLEPSPFFLNGI